MARKKREPMKFTFVHVFADGSRLEGSMKDLNYEMPDLPGNQEIANKVIDIFDNHARKKREMEAGIYESSIR